MTRWARCVEARELAAAAVRAATIEGFLGATGRFLSTSDLKVERLFLSIQTLHPAFRARTYLWNRTSDEVEIEEWPHGLENRPGYYDSPDFHVHGSREELRIRNPGNFRRSGCDLYGELAAEGVTDYFMVPLLFGDGIVNTFSIATKAVNGFSDGELDDFRGLRDIFAVILERYAALEMAASTLTTYLGRSATQEVLHGRIRAGQGERLEAAILFADMRDFTSLAAELDPVETVRLLNAYFDCLVGPIEANHGHVLKFIGDAVLAFFPVPRGGPDPTPVRAVRAIRKRLADLNRRHRDEGRPPIRHGLCLHFGEVIYGNVGSTERLDFTIIGQAVNTAARVEEATRASEIDYLLTEDFVKRFGKTGLKRVDSFSLRGVPQPITLFTFLSGA